MSPLPGPRPDLLERSDALAPWIGGAPVNDGVGDRREIVDPARDRLLAEVRDASSADVDAAVRAARSAFDSGSWRDRSAAERAAALQRIAASVREHGDELALLDSLNVGKPIAQARLDCTQAADFFDNCAHVIATLEDEILENTDTQLTLVAREPVGVVAAVIPWNFPLTIAASAVAPALAAGNSVVLKPSPETPLSAIRLAELLGEHLPAGVLSVLPGGTEVGRAITHHAEVDRIAFTGSAETGAEIMQVASSGFKRVGLELGGKSATVVFEDAPFEAAVESALQRFTLNQGENCAAGSRLLVQETIANEFVEALIQAAGVLHAGDPQQEATDIGPMISRQHRERVLAHVEAAETESKLLFTGAVPSEPPLSEGFFVPVSIWEAGPGTRLWADEVFGPVLAVTRFRDENEAVQLANDSQYGLMAVVWCGDRARGLRVARRTRAGIVRINGAGSPTGGPWGGFKRSGIGRAYGKYGIEESTELKQINVDLR